MRQGVGVGGGVVVIRTTDVGTSVTICPHVGSGGVVFGVVVVSTVVPVGAGTVVKLVIVVGVAVVVVGGTHVGDDEAGGSEAEVPGVVGGGVETVVAGTGGGGIDGGAGRAAALGAPIGTVLSGTCMIPLR